MSSGCGAFTYLFSKPACTRFKSVLKASVLRSYSEFGSLPQPRRVGGEMKTLMCSALLCSGAAIVLAGSAKSENSDSLSAAAILERVGAVYAGAQTYRDSGLVKTNYAPPNHSFSTDMPFTTAYSAPERFRLEFHVAFPDNSNSLNRRWIVFRNANEVKEWSFLKPIVSAPTSLDLAIAGASGVSEGVAHNIPALLMPQEISGRKLTANADASRRIDDAHCGAAECFRVESTIHTEAGETTRTLWIGKSSFLIQRIDRHTVLANQMVDSTTTYNPVLNAPVSDELLALNIPSDPKTADDSPR
jgi:hypothetical protein